MRREYLGIAAACGSSCLGGASIVATRAVVGQIDPASVAALRYGIGALCLVALAVLVRGSWPRRGDLVPIALLGVLFFAGFPFLFNLSLSYTTAARGSLVLSTLPLLTLVVAALLRSEAVTPAKIGGVAIAGLGVAIALGDKIATDPGLRTGDLLMLATALCGAFYNVLSRPYLSRIPALSYTTAGMIAGAAAGISWALVWGAPARAFDLPGWTWASVGFLGIGGAALTFFLWSFGLEHTTPTRVATTVTLNPLVAMLLGSILLGEPLPARLALGLAAIAAGIACVSHDRPDRPKAIVASFASWRRRRAELQALRRLDERTLQDVGLLDKLPCRDRPRSLSFWLFPPWQ